MRHNLGQFTRNLIFFFVSSDLGSDDDPIFDQKTTHNFRWKKSLLRAPWRIFDLMRLLHYSLRKGTSLYEEYIDYMYENRLWNKGV